MSSNSRFLSALRILYLFVFLGNVNPIYCFEKTLDVMINGAFPKDSPYKDLRMIGYDEDGNLETQEFVFFEFSDTAEYVTYLFSEHKEIINEPSRFRFTVKELNITRYLPRGVSSPAYYMAGTCHIWEGSRRDKKTSEVIDKAKEWDANYYVIEITKDFYDWLEIGFGDEIIYTEHICEPGVFFGLNDYLYDGVRMDSLQREKFYEELEASNFDDSVSDFDDSAFDHFYETYLLEEAVKTKDLTFTINGISFVMKYVEGGTFTMGATSEQAGLSAEYEYPTHLVTLSNFYIGKYEVTQELWKAVMGNNPSYYKGDNFPVTSVTWDHCQTFINDLNKLLSSKLEGKHFALPTEAQWEYAARGGNKSHSYRYSGSNDFMLVAEDYSHKIRCHAVGTKLPNELGIYDMSCNVYEWCQDWYGKYDNNPQTNPTGPAQGKFRVVRAGDARVSHRVTDYYPNSVGDHLGFRLVLLP